MSDKTTTTAEKVLMNDSTAKMLVDKLGRTYHAKPEMVRAIEMPEPFLLKGGELHAGDFIVEGKAGYEGVPREQFLARYQARKERKAKGSKT